VKLNDFAERFLKLKSEIQKLKSEKKQEEVRKEENEINNLRKVYYDKIKSLLNRKAEEWKKEYKKERDKI